jgi:hypothetical protein
LLIVVPSKKEMPPPGSGRRVKLQHGAGAGPALDRALGRASRTTGVDIDKDKLFELGLQLGASPASRGDAQSNAYGRLARHAPNDYFAISA